MEIENLTIGKLQDGFLKKKFSAREVVDFFIARIDKHDSQINSFVTKTFDTAREEANDADKTIADYGKDAFEQYPLLGIPIAHKDLYLTNGVRTTASSKVLDKYIPQYSATVVKRLEKAGAITLGKLNCDAWGHGSSGEFSDFGQTRNPWDIRFVPGGSSSGSAAAIAAGFSSVATGTDTGGSVRLPASFCGVVGLKPTYGRVSRYGVVAMASSLDSMGHLTKTVEDAAKVLQITAGKDECDATTKDEIVPTYALALDSDIKDLRIGLPKEYFAKGVDKAVKSAVKKAAGEVEKLGAKLEEISLPNTEYAIAAYYILMPSEVSSNLARYDGIRYGNNRDFFGEEARRRIMLGTHTLSSGYIDQYYKKAKAVQTVVQKDFEEAFKKIDILLAPVSPTPPFKLGEKTADPLEMYLSDVLTVAVNLSGLPALALPCGESDEGLPIGMQFIGKKFDEATLFRVGHAYQQVTDWHKRRPNIE